MGDNSAPLKTLHAVCTYTPILGPALFDGVIYIFPLNPRWHGNKFLDKIGYNSAPVKDNCALFAPTAIFLGPGYLMLSFTFLSWQPLLPWQRILGQNLL